MTDREQHEADKTRWHDLAEEVVEAVERYFTLPNATHMTELRRVTQNYRAVVDARREQDERKEARFRDTVEHRIVGVW